MNPDQYTQGGLLDNMDVRVTAAKYETFDYNGTTSDVPALALTLIPLDGSGAESVQHWPCGDLKHFVPSDDGMTLEPASPDAPASIRNNTNLATLLKEMVTLGMAKNKLDSGRADVFVGLEMHVARKKSPNQDTGGKDKPADAKDRQILLPTKIIKWPWENKKNQATGNTRTTTNATTNSTSSAPANTTNTATATASSNSTDWASNPHKDTVAAAVTGFLTGKNAVSRMDLKKGIFSLVQLPVADKKIALTLIDSDDFLGSINVMPEGAEVTLMA